VRGNIRLGALSLPPATPLRPTYQASKQPTNQPTNHSSRMLTYLPCGALYQVKFVAFYFACFNIYVD